jgi:hypothetical protein
MRLFANATAFTSYPSENSPRSSHRLGWYFDGRGLSFQRLILDRLTSEEPGEEPI